MRNNRVKILSLNKEQLNYAGKNDKMKLFKKKQMKKKIMRNISEDMPKQHSTNYLNRNSLMKHLKLLN